MPGNDRNKAYLNYLRDHPELLEDEPPHASSPSFWLKMLQEERCSGEEMYKSVRDARRKWEQFHLENARVLGFDISIQRLHLDKSWIFGVATHGSQELDSQNR